LFKGGYDAATNTDLDVAPAGSTRLDVCSYSCWYFFTEDVEAGDLIISKQNAPTTLAHYTVVNKNIRLFLLLQQ
jgi:hypothetical protein